MKTQQLAVSAVDRSDPYEPYAAPGGFHLEAARSRAILQWSSAGRLLRSDHGLTGAGTDHVERYAARTRAVAELVERQTAFLYADLKIVEASKEELGDTAISLDLIPRCSDLEFSNARCPVQRPDSGQCIEWISARNLVTGDTRLVPLSLVLLGGRKHLSEVRLVAPISTGFAAHQDPTRALLAGLIEIIERDAIALTWEAQLRLPLLDPTAYSDAVHRFLDEDSRRGIQSILFDATTDIDRVSVVYCLQLDQFNDEIAQSVHCSAGIDVTGAAEKVLRESASTRLSLSQAAMARPIANIDQISQVADGAVYMGQRGRRPAFDFLRESRDQSLPPEYPRGDHGEELARVIAQLAAKGVELYAINVSSRAARKYGLTVVRVIAFGLMPMSLNPFARYRAEPRMYTYPRTRFAKQLNESDLNPWPQPFA